MTDSNQNPADNISDIMNNRVYLEKLVNTRMSFGKYAGRYLIDLPEPYMIWMNSKGYPYGEIGNMLKIIYEVKVNGLEELLRPIKKKSF